MSKSSKVLVIFLTISFIVINTYHVNCLESDLDSTETESTDDYYDTSTESSAQNLNDTDSNEEYIDYEGENVYDTNEDRDKETIFDKLKAIHSENKDLKPIKYVNHINETLDIVDRLLKIIIDLVKPRVSERDMSRILEIFYSIDVPVDCLSSLVRIGSAMSREELWAFKCKSCYIL